MGEYEGITDKIYKAFVRWPETNIFPDPIGIILYAHPIIELKGRSQALSEKLSTFSSCKERLTFFNKNIRYIARVIVDPRFHRQGIASFLLKETLKLQTVPIIETQTPIDFTQSMFGNAGFRLIYVPAPTYYAPMIDVFENLGLPRHTWNIAKTILDRIKSLSASKRYKVMEAMTEFLNHFGYQMNEWTDTKKIEKTTIKFPYPNAYMIRIDPNIPLIE